MPADANTRVEGEREWQVEVRAGAVVTRAVRVTFTQVGEVELLAGVYDSATGRATSGGQRTRVSASTSMIQSQGFGGWVSVAHETFEGIWPSAGWAVNDLSNDGYQRYWGDDEYRAHTDSWAAWPARRGADGLDPVTPDDHYFNTMDTRMIYGPFDLSDAVMADADFWLCREIETCFDYVVLDISHADISLDCVAVQELARWTGSSGWEFSDVYFNDYVGDNSVWLAWRFVSDSSVTYDGPWVDDVRIWKFVPGEVTASGTFHYYDRQDSYVPARFTSALLYDADPGGVDDLLASTTTDGNGFFQFPPLLNWDSDDSSQDPFARRLDLYVVWETDSNDGPSRRKVTSLLGTLSQWGSGVHTNASDGAVAFANYVENGSGGERAMWLFDDLHRAKDYVVATTGSSPGTAEVRWEYNVNCFFFNVQICNSGFWPAPAQWHLHLKSACGLTRRGPSRDLAPYMYNAMGQWFWQAEQWYDWWFTCIDHDVFVPGETALCAWTEGWADFMPMAVQGTNVWNGHQIEAKTWPVPPDPDGTGDAIEGRVAGALYDLFDNTNDGWDQVSFGFSPIWNILRTGTRETNFSEFWSSWRSQGYGQHLAVQAIYQNTIDYDTAPAVAGLPDIALLQDTSRNNAMDLWTYASDAESSDAELAYTVAAVSDLRCGVTIDALSFVDIAPQAGWWGSCTVTIRVSDGIKVGTDSFIVTVTRIVSRQYLPLVVKPYIPPPYPILLAPAR